MNQDIHLFQVAYNAETLAQVQASGFMVLDNLANERPDWYEYWPIRKFLLTQTLDDNAYYGFFSPKFTHKTQMTHADVGEFIREVNAKSPVDVVLFSPQPDMGANFLNVFEQAELFDPGCIAVAQDFLKTQGLEVPLGHIVMDSRQVVFSNYFVARPTFWRLWFGLTEALFAQAEDLAHPLYAALNFNTSYGANANRKVFISERLASLLLCLHSEFRAATANIFNFGWSTSRFRDCPENTYVNDALKRAYRDTGFSQYMQAFTENRARFAAAGKLK